MLNPIRGGLRLVNRTNGLARVELRLQPGDEIEVPEGSVLEQDRGPLTPVEAPQTNPAPAAADTGEPEAPVEPEKAEPARKEPAKKAPAKRAPRKRS